MRDDQLFDDVLEMLDDDRDPRTIASIIGCSVQQVYQIIDKHSVEEAYDDSW